MAAALAKAARAHAKISQREARLRCELEVACYRRQLILLIEIEPWPMQFNVKSKVDFAIGDDFGDRVSTMAR